MSDPRTKPSKSAHHLVTFKWGELDADGPFAERYTDYTSEVQSGGLTYRSIPELEIDIPEQTGIFEESPLSIKAKAATEWLKRISNGEPFARVSVTVVDRSVAQNGEELLRTPFVGRLDHSVRNKDGSPQVVELVARTLKDSDLVVPFGLFANPDCGHTFGDHNCGVVRTIDVGTIIRVQNHRVDITGLAPTPWDHWYFRGWIEREGLRINIRQTALGGTRFLLSKPAPRDWLNQPVRLSNGCRKKTWSCNEYGNISEFGGYGLTIPDYHPSFEQPTQ